MRNKLLLIVAGIFISFLIFCAGILFHRKYDGHLLIDWVKSPLQNIQRKIYSWKARPEILSVSIEPKYLKKLEKFRNEAIAEGYLLQDMQKEVPCFIVFNTDTLTATIRLKGNAEDHFKFEKVSYRIKLNDDKTVFGVNEFSLQHPKIRNYAHEWFIHQWMKENDILTLKYDFIQLNVNNENKGIYALEEHFAKQLVEKNKNRLGVILRFDEEHYLDKIKHGIDELDIDYKASPIQAYSQKSMAKSPELTKQYNNAINLLQEFRNGKLPVYKVFDIEKWAKYCALLDICNGTESYFFWPNARIYYNPITSKIEPIGYSYERSTDEDSKAYLLDALRAEKYPHYEFAYSLLKDSVFVNAYTKALQKFTQPDILEKFYKKNESKLNQKLAILDKEYMSEFKFNFDSYQRKRDFLAQQLKPERALVAYLKEVKPDSLILQVACTHRIATIVYQLSYKDSVLYNFSQERVFPAIDSKDFPRFTQIALPVSTNDISSKKNFQTKLKLRYHIENSSTEMVCNVLPFPFYNEKLIKADIIRHENNIEKFDFLSINKDKKTIEFKRGKYLINETLIIPENYTVKAFSGTNLTLSNNAMIISNSPFVFIGTEDEPITISGTPNQDGRGLIIFNQNQKSVFKYVDFIQLTNPKTEAWSVSGAVNVYAGFSEFSNCSFQNNYCEDALNLIKSSIAIKNCIFRNTYADAFDSDFCNGTIENCSFFNSKNDALDFSGSMVNVKHIIFENIADKALSAGESSEITAENLKLNNCELAFTSKDLSKLKIDNAEIYNTRAIYIAFTKKNEFGPSAIMANNIKVHTKPKYQALLSEDCTLTIDGKAYKKYTQNVFEMLYGNELGVKSK